MLSIGLQARTQDVQKEGYIQGRCKIQLGVGRVLQASPWGRGTWRECDFQSIFSLDFLFYHQCIINVLL